MEGNKEKILQFMRQKGPVLPVEVSKQIQSNILMASAHLSELSSNSKIRVSNVKVGGSPLYFLPGQESQLQRFADNLHEKEKRAYGILSRKKVLRDAEQEPLIRVALRAIKDYAVPLQVNFKGSSEIFWRWFLLTNKEAEDLIRPMISEITAPEPPKEPAKTPGLQQKQQQPEKPAPITKSEIKKEEPITKKIGDIKPGEGIQRIKKPKTAKIQEPNEFLEKISGYFNKNRIDILSRDIIRKTEVDLILHVPSAVGSIEYYCKAKNKKKINDADLSSAFAQGQLRKMPVLLLTNGELTKRASEMLQKDFKGMGVKRI